MGISKLVSVALALSLAGCACERHPVACWAGAVIVAGSVAASTNDRMADRHIPSPGVDCASGSCK